jgi:hypothetical protein
MYPGSTQPLKMSTRIFLGSRRSVRMADKLPLSSADVMQSGSLRADSHIPWRSHAVPLPCRSAKGLDCDFPIWYTPCGRVWFTHTMSFPCHATNMPFWKRLPKAMAVSWQGEGMRRHVGDLPAFGLLLLPRAVPDSLLSEAYQSPMQWPVWNRAAFVMDEIEAYYFGVRTWVLV